MTDERIELLASLVQRKWRALKHALESGDPAWVVQQEKEEWAAASLLLELAQEAQHRNRLSALPLQESPLWFSHPFG